MEIPDAKKEEREGSFGKLLNTIRNKRKISLRNLSMRAGISPSYLSKIENNLSPPPSASIIMKIAVCLKVSEDDLLIRAGYLPEEMINNENIHISLKIIKALKGLDKKLLEVILDFATKLIEHLKTNHKQE